MYPLSLTISLPLPLKLETRYDLKMNSKTSQTVVMMTGKFITYHCSGSEIIDTAIW